MAGKSIAAARGDRIQSKAKKVEKWEVAHSLDYS
eukprot:COSAG02_NODE_68791_length_220_cov_73.066116_1_plen_33_part_10